MALSGPCKSYQEQLVGLIREGKTLAVDSPCPVCRVRVGFHDHAPGLPGGGSGRPSVTVDAGSASTVVFNNVPTSGFLAQDPVSSSPVLFTVSHHFVLPDAKDEEVAAVIKRIKESKSVTAHLSVSREPLKINFRALDIKLDCAVFDVELPPDSKARPLSLDPLAGPTVDTIPSPLGLRLQGACLLSLPDGKASAKLFDGRCIQSQNDSPHHFVLDGSLPSHGCSGTALVKKSHPMMVCGMTLGVSPDFAGFGSVALEAGTYSLPEIGMRFMDCLVGAHKANTWTVFLASSAMLQLLADNVR